MDTLQTSIELVLFLLNLSNVSMPKPVKYRILTNPQNMDSPKISCAIFDALFVYGFVDLLSLYDAKFFVNGTFFF